MTDEQKDFLTNWIKQYKPYDFAYFEKGDFYPNKNVCFFSMSYEALKALKELTKSDIWVRVPNEDEFETTNYHIDVDAFELFVLLNNQNCPI